MPDEAESVNRLRLRIGERVPANGSAADTLFSDEEILDILATTNSMTEAVAVGWHVKAANLAHLVDVTEADSGRTLSQRYKHAKEMADFWTGKADLETGGRTAVVGVAANILRIKQHEVTFGDMHDVAKRA